jgi:hypothetical protein
VPGTGRTRYTAPSSPDTSARPCETACEAITVVLEGIVLAGSPAIGAFVILLEGDDIAVLFTTFFGVRDPDFVRAALTDQHHYAHTSVEQRSMLPLRCTVDVELAFNMAITEKASVGVYQHPGAIFFLAPSRPSQSYL